MLDLRAHVRENIVNRVNTVIARIAIRHCQNLLIVFRLIDHVQNAYGADVHQAPGEARFINQDQRVKRIAIVAERAWNEAVIARIMHGGVKRAIEPEDAEISVVFIFVRRIFWNLDDGANNFGTLGTRVDVIEFHAFNVAEPRVGAKLEAMSAKVRWGVLGVANIATRKVIPGMQKSARCEMRAIASRDADRARRAAQELGLSKAYGSYEELLADPEIDAVYNPLPNHLHVPWSIEAARAGKHVLCEKPIAMSAAEGQKLIEVRNQKGVKIGEAFMVRTHPLWLRARELVRSGETGNLRSIMSTFSYFNRDPNNIRNVLEFGGGGIMDIGCYPITMSRFLFGREPSRVAALIERDPGMQIDRLSSATLDFAPGQAVFMCSTQLVPFQRMQIFGEKGRIEIEIPYNIPPDEPTRIFIDNGSQPAGRSARVEEFDICDQYMTQGEAFSKAIQEDTEVPVPLEDALGNMRVIDAVFRAAESGGWETP